MNLSGPEPPGTGRGEAPACRGPAVPYLCPEPCPSLRGAAIGAHTARSSPAPGPARTGRAQRSESEAEPLSDVRVRPRLGRALGIAAGGESGELGAATARTGHPAPGCLDICLYPAWTSACTLPAPSLCPCLDICLYPTWTSPCTPAWTSLCTLPGHLPVSLPGHLPIPLPYSASGSACISACTLPAPCLHCPKARDSGHGQVLAMGTDRTPWVTDGSLTVGIVRFMPVGKDLMWMAVGAAL